MKNDDISRKLRDKMWQVGEELEEIRESLRERKTERLQLRVTPTEKEEVEFMTELLGVSAADYLMHLHRRAMKDVHRRNESRGGGRDRPRHERKRRRGGDDGDGAGVTLRR